MSKQILVAERHVSPKRVALVTLGLIPTGAAAGALAGALGVTLWVGLAEGFRAALDPSLWTVAGVVGAALGAVLLPLAGFTVLRYVPLGRALAETILGTAIGGAVGVQFLEQGWLLGALAGFGMAAIRLRLMAKRARARGPRSPEPAA
jgi:hypothetical protein